MNFRDFAAYVGAAIFVCTALGAVIAFFGGVLGWKLSAILIGVGAISWFSLWGFVTVCSEHGNKTT